MHNLTDAQVRATTTGSKTWRNWGGGDLVTVAVQGDLGKPRPALVIQADQFSEDASATVLPITGMRVAAPLLRVTLQPSEESGLRKPSQAMVDKVTTVKRDKIGPAFGRIDANAMAHDGSAIW